MAEQLRPPEETSALDPADVRSAREALAWGADLYHQGFPWEAHEVWEAVWHTLPRGGRGRSLVQGLVQMAAGEVLLACGRGRSGRRVLRRAASLLSGPRADDAVAGRLLDPDRLAAEVLRRAEAGGPRPRVRLDVPPR